MAEEININIISHIENIFKVKYYFEYINNYNTCEIIYLQRYMNFK